MFFDEDSGQPGARLRLPFQVLGSIDFWRATEIGSLRLVASSRWFILHHLLIFSLVGSVLAMFMSYSLISQD